LEGPLVELQAEFEVGGGLQATLRAKGQMDVIVGAHTERTGN